MRITIIAAVADNGAIGRDGEIPWHLPADLAFFKRTTMGHTLVMGRRTFESAGALPGRATIVLTRDPRYRPAEHRPQRPDGPPVEVAHGLEEALERAEASGEEEVFVCGGSRVYAEALHGPGRRADRMLLTRVEGEPGADAWFPEWDRDAWRLVSREDHEPDEKNSRAYSFREYERLPAEG